MTETETEKQKQKVRVREGDRHRYRDRLHKQEMLKSVGLVTNFPRNEDEAEQGKLGKREKIFR